MRFTEIDGKRYEVEACRVCPFRDMGDGGYAAHCTHPNAEPYMDDMLWIEDDGVSISEGCPLREVEEPKETLKPCPFCGSDQVRMELSIYRYPFVICLNCRTTSRCADLKGKDGIKEVVEVWNRRAEE